MPVAEGLTLPFDSPDSIRSDLLERIDYQGGEQLIRYHTPEWSCVCPFSGLPDFGSFSMTYVPSDYIVELKSLKYYLVSYRTVGIYQELATTRLLTDLWQLLVPVYLQVDTVYRPRGGIHAHCTQTNGTLPSPLRSLLTVSSSPPEGGHP